MLADFPGWVNYANCAGLPDEVFTPSDECTDDAAWYEGELGQAAIAICRQCIVRKECFEYSLLDVTTIENGVYGGTTPKDRERYLQAVSLRSGHSPGRDEGPDQGRAGSTLDSCT